jgi:hypothetical protein
LTNFPTSLKLIFYIFIWQPDFLWSTFSRNWTQPKFTIELVRQSI